MLSCRWVLDLAGMVTSRWAAASVATLCVVCGACGKKTSAQADSGARSVSAPPPPAVSGSPWLVKNPDGTYAIDPHAECTEILSGSAPELALAPLSPAKGVRAEVSRENVLTVAPLGLRAKLPEGAFGPSWVRTRGPDLDKVRTSAGEWERAYAELLDRSLPFESLLVHASDEPWGAAATYSGLGIRLHAVAEPVDVVLASLAARLPVVAVRVACGNEHGRLHDSSPRSSVTHAERPPWKTMQAKMRVYYGDYGGQAVVELYVRRVRDVTLVLAFMFEGDGHQTERAALADALNHP